VNEAIAITFDDRRETRNIGGVDSESDDFRHDKRRRAASPA
jgi:hypothetical protein